MNTINRSFVSYGVNNHNDVLAALRRTFPSAVFNGPATPEFRDVTKSRQVITVVGVPRTVTRADVRKAIPRKFRGHMY